MGDGDQSVFGHELSSRIAGMGPKLGLAAGFQRISTVIITPRRNKDKCSALPSS